MPVQKGKRRRRPRHRSSLERPLDSEAAPSKSSGADHKGSARPVRRAGRTQPLWVNVVIGIGMLVLGAIFTFIVPQKGMSVGVKLALFIGYCIIAAFYLSKAYRQYRARGDA